MEQKKRQNKTGNKKAQVMEMSFQSIFSVILIVVFIVAAGIAIKMLLGKTEHAQVIQSLQELKTDIEEVWLKTSATSTISIDFPAKIKYVCFSNNLEGANKTDFPSEDVYLDLYMFKGRDADVFFYPSKVMEGYGINTYMKIECGTQKKRCLDLSALAESGKNPYCIENKGAVKIKLEKEMGQSKVQIIPE